MISTTCRVCNKTVEAIFSTVLLQKHSAQFFKCSQCGYVQTEDPHWLEEAYESTITDSDTGMIIRNLWFRNITTTLIYFLFNNKGKFLDCGGGYGVFVRLMRDAGFDFYWQDKHTENLFAKGFVFPVSEKLTIELLTCFETFEHFVEPVTELENLLSISQNILLSTEFIPEPTPPPGEWWYYGVEHGQHIGFFRKKTFSGKKFFGEKVFRGPFLRKTFFPPGWSCLGLARHRERKYSELIPGCNFHPQTTLFTYRTSSGITRNSTRK